MENFTIEKKGYSIEEVDRAIDDLESKNTFLAKENADLRQKLESARRLIRRFSDMENELRQNIADSKRAAADMINDTKARNEALLDTTREECGKIISDLDIHVAERMDIVDNMKMEVITFKEQLFDLYSSHIDLIEKMAEKAENFVYVPNYAPVAETVEKFEEETEKESNIEPPEFVDYPQESIFEDFKEEEKTEGQFAIEESIEELPKEDEMTFDHLSDEEEKQDENLTETFESIEAEEESDEVSFDFNMDADLDEETDDEPDDEGTEYFFEENSVETESDDVSEELFVYNESDIDVESVEDTSEKMFTYEEEKVENSEDEEYFTFLKSFIEEDEINTENEEK